MADPPQDLDGSPRNRPVRVCYALACGFGFLGLPAGLLGLDLAERTNAATLLLIFLTLIGIAANATSRFLLGGFRAAEVMKNSSKAGCLAIVVAASMVVLAGRLKATSHLPLSTLLGGLLTILPAISFSLLLMAMIPLLQSLDGQSPTGAPVGDGTALALKSATFSLTALGFASAFVGFGNRESREMARVDAQAATPSPPNLNYMAPPPADPKSEAPFAEANLTPEPELASAPIPRLKLKSLQSLGSRVADADHDIAADGRTFAYFRYDLRDLIAVDLEHLKILARVELPHEAREVRFSPDAKRLLALPVSPEAPLMLVKLENRTVTVLPRTFRAALPSPPFAWWNENEILLQPRADRPVPAMFLLDRLETVPLDQAAAWTKLTDEERDAWLKTDRRPTVAAARYRLIPCDLPEAAMHPAHDGTQDWAVRSSPGWLMSDSSHAFAQRVLGLPIHGTATTRAALGGMAVLIFHDATTEIASFTVADPPVLTFMVAMPHEADHEDCSPDVHDAMKTQALAALIYPPLVNPLTGKVIGPDRRRIKAVARFRKWEGTTAMIHIETLLAPVAAGDVVADPGHSSSKETRLLSRITAEAPWWAQLQPITSQPVESPVPPLRQDVHSPLLFSEGGLAPTGGDSSPAFPKGFHYLPSDPGELQRIRTFVRNHIDAANRQDFEQFANDFSEVVNPYFGGPKTRAAIREGESGRQRDTKSVTERLASPIQIAARTDGNVDATFRLTADIEYTTGKIDRSEQRFTLRIRKQGAQHEISGVFVEPTED
jgi:hypothetical protein